MSSCSRLAAVLSLFGAMVFGQNPIQYGNTVRGTIECGQTVTYTLTASQGDRLVAHLTETADRGGICPSPFGPVAACAFDQCLEVRNEANELIGTVCTPIERNACLNQIRSQLGPVTLPKSGRYSIVVRDADHFGRGDFALSLQRSSNPAQAVTLNIPDVRVVPLQTAGAVQAFTFPAAEGRDLNIELKPQAGSSVVPRLALYGPDGEPAALPAGGQIRYAARQAGQHTLLAFSSVYETGVAQLTLSPAPLPNPNWVLAQIADGGGWRTALTLVNHGDQPAPFTIGYWTSGGVRWPLVFDTPEQGSIPPGGSRTLNTLGTAPVNSQGWAELASSGRVGVHAIFRSSSGQEAVVPAMTGTNRLLLPFDNTRDVVTSMAIVNTSDARTASVRVVFRDESGGVIGTDTLALLPRSHDAFAMPTRFPSTSDRRGVAEFGTEGPDLAILGLRFTPGGAFTSVPEQPALP